jgi:hypothetical protein
MTGLPLHQQDDLYTIGGAVWGQVSSCCTLVDLDNQNHGCVETSLVPIRDKPLNLLSRLGIMMLEL